MTINPKRRFSEYFYNRLTYIGVALASLVFLIECFLFAIDLMAHRDNLYMGIITFVILPPFLILGLILIPIGALRKRWRVRHHLEPLLHKPLHVDLSKHTHRRTLLIFSVGTLILIAMSAVGAYRGFHYTESVSFCGTMCHQIMEPEHKAYLQSPHSNVKCATCHIGDGASHYVESKMTGARQLLHTVMGNYEKPVKTPVKALRPASEICLQCHSPSKKFGHYDFIRNYHISDPDAENQKWHLRMQIPMGTDAHGNAGLHNHMTSDHEIYYAAEDAERQNITWVKSVDKDGTATIFTTPDSKFAGKMPPQQAIRKMDCIDCHNRPTHRFVAPTRLLDDAMNSGSIDASIPGLKGALLEVLSDDYETVEEAEKAIKTSVEKFYKKVNKSAEIKADEAAVNAVVRETSELYRDNFFPLMKTRWDTHPDNIGHMINPGCFRCHSGEHKSPEGRPITQRCTACHQIIEQGPPGKVVKDLNGIKFVHPTDDDVDLKPASCTDCHTGGF